MIDAGKYNKKIKICSTIADTDKDGFQTEKYLIVLEPWASVKTTRGMTLIAAGSDFEKAYTNFTIRYPSTEITRDMTVVFGSRVYSIEYINNVDNANVELELQCKEVTH